MFFAGLASVLIVKDYDLGRESARSQFFTIRTPQPANNIYIQEDDNLECKVIIRVTLFLQGPLSHSITAETSHSPLSSRLFLYKS